jgi:hypothetical protein
MTPFVAALCIETFNNIDLIDTNYHQMALRSVPTSHLFEVGTPGQTKVSGDRQRETTHEICCLAAEFTYSRLCNLILL